MPRWIAAFLIFALCATAAHAQTGRKLLLISGGVPSWVLRAGGVPANVDMNFATGQYYGCSLASCLSITRASSKTNLLPSSPSGFSYTTFGNNVLSIDSNGLLIEEARTNQLLNSTVPATQTTGSLANGTYTLWVNGSGSAQMSLGTGVGCGVGTATNGTPVNFTISTPGTCIVTVTGSLNAFQLELGAFGTSLIVTAGAAATRATDSVGILGKLLTFLLPSVSPANTAIRFKTSSVQATGAGNVIFGNNFSSNRFFANNTTSAQLLMSGFNLSATLGSGSMASTSPSACVFSWGSTATLVCNQGTEASGGSNASTGTGASLGLSDGYVSRISAWPSTLSTTLRSGLSNPSL